MRSVILVAATFLACSVEMVEALTIVLAAAFARGWYSLRLGIAAALVALAVVVALLFMLFFKDPPRMRAAGVL